MAHIKLVEYRCSSPAMAALSVEIADAKDDHVSYSCVSVLPVS